MMMNHSQNNIKHFLALFILAFFFGVITGWLMKSALQFARCISVLLQFAHGLVAVAICLFILMCHLLRNHSRLNVLPTLINLLGLLTNQRFLLGFADLWADW